MCVCVHACPTAAAAERTPRRGARRGLHRAAPCSAHAFVYRGGREPWRKRGKCVSRARTIAWIRRGSCISKAALAQAAQPSAPASTAPCTTGCRRDAPLRSVRGERGLGGGRRERWRARGRREMGPGPETPARRLPAAGVVVCWAPGQRHLRPPMPVLAGERGEEDAGPAAVAAAAVCSARAAACAVMRIIILVLAVAMPDNSIAMMPPPPPSSPTFPLLPPTPLRQAAARGAAARGLKG